MAGGWVPVIVVCVCVCVGGVLSVMESSSFGRLCLG